MFRDLAELCARLPIAALVVNEREIEGRSYTPKLGALADTVLAAAAETTAAPLPARVLNETPL